MRGVAAAAEECKLHPHTIRRALNAGEASPRTLVALERIKNRLRTADEFLGSARMAAVAPRRNDGVYSWTLEAIRKARDAQLRGDFQLPVQLAAAMRTDDALFSAYHNRIAPQAAIRTELRAAPGARGEACRKRAMGSVIVARPTLQGIVGTLADHGIAIGYNEQEVANDGSQIDFRLTEWPLEFVKWNRSKRCLETQVDCDGGLVPIVHGDGRWVVFRKFEVEPWRQEACVLPGALLWAGHANAVKDWAAGSASHGQAKIVGELPEGWALRDANGQLTAEAKAFINMLQDMVSGEVGAGLRPHGAITDFLSNSSTAWQVFKELVLDRSKAAARIYLGTDAMMGSVGGAPGIDIATLFGVATTKVQGDFQAIESALRVGVYEPWAAMNEGNSRYAPSFWYLMPDPDEQRNAEEYDKRFKALLETIKALKDQSCIVDQPTIDLLAKRYNVEPPQLAPIAESSVPLTLAPTDIAKVVRADEVRRSQGLPAFGDARGSMTIPELDAAAKATATPPAVPPAATLP